MFFIFRFLNTARTEKEASALLEEGSGNEQVRENDLNIYLSDDQQEKGHIAVDENELQFTDFNQFIKR